MPTKSVEAPRAALQFEAGRFAFAASESEGSGKSPITAVIRSNEPIDHWYWGPIIHDNAGFQANPSIPLDYCHDVGEVIGYLDSFAAGPEGLTAKGQVVSVQQGDRGQEIMLKAKAGIPWQSSIFFEPLVIEEVSSGARVQVNGTTFSGPGLVVRQWRLRGVAVCPYGYDPNTSAQFAAHKADVIKLTYVSQQKDGAMSTDTKTAETKSAEAAADRKNYTDDLKSFVAKFGAENGVKWFTEGKSLPEALELHCTALNEKMTAVEKDLSEKLTAGEKAATEKFAALQAELDDAKKKLTATKPGEKEPVSFSAENPADKGGNKLEGLAAFAAGIKLPGKK